MDLAAAQSVLDHLARSICDAQPKIIDEWIQAVERDGRFQAAEHLEKEELEGLLPPIFNALTDMLRAPRSPENIERADEGAKTQGQRRFCQGYRLDELLREQARLRDLVLTEALDFEERSPDFHGFVKRIALQRINRFFDNLMCDSAAQFSTEKDTGVRKQVTEVQTQRAKAQEECRSAEQTNARNLEATDETMARLFAKIDEADAVCDRFGQFSDSMRTMRDLKTNLTEMKHLISELVG